MVEIKHVVTFRYINQFMSGQYIKRPTQLVYKLGARENHYTFANIGYTL